jgi:hypothetical protein
MKVRELVGLSLAAALCAMTATLAAQLGYSNNKAVLEIMAVCERPIGAAERACRAARDCEVTNAGQWRGYADNMLKQPQAIAGGIADAERRIREGGASQATHYEAILCLYRGAQKFTSSASAPPPPTPRPAPPPAPRPPTPTPDTAEARRLLMERYKDVLSDVLADLERIPTLRKNAPPPPKNAAAMKDENTRGEDAVGCMSIVWPANALSAPLIQNHCRYPVEAVWCVQPCGKSGNMWTIFPNSDDYEGYPIIETEKIVRGREIWFGACRGRNSIHAGPRPQTYTCGPPGK